MWDSSNITTEPGMVLHTRNPNNWEVKAGGSEVQGQPQLHSKVEASLGYMTPYFKEQTEAMDLDQWVRQSQKTQVLPLAPEMVEREPTPENRSVTSEPGLVPEIKDAKAFSFRWREQYSHFHQQKVIVPLYLYTYVQNIQCVAHWMSSFMSSKVKRRRGKERKKRE